MRLNANGFYEPVVMKPLLPSEAQMVKRLCPGVHVEAEGHHGVWGHMLSICEAWASDADVRHRAASGGVVTSLAVCVLENQLVDAVLQVGVRNDSYLYNELQISRTKEDVLRNAQSRYAPALTLYRIKDIFDCSTDSFAFIGKPCDIAAMKNLEREFPQYAGRVKYFCRPRSFCIKATKTKYTWRMN